MRFKYSLFAVRCLLVALLPGCMATHRDVAGMKETLSEIQGELKEVRETQADCLLKLNEVNLNILLLSGRMDEEKRRLNRLGQKLESINSGSSSPLTTLGESPGEMYRLAYEDFSRGKYNLAILGFRQYLTKYPGGELAASSQYYIAQSYFHQKNWKKAKEEFERLNQYRPEEELVRGGQFKIALSLIELNRLEEADKLLKEIIDRYPQTREASLAREKREELKNRPSP